jgi:LysM repeat protein
MSKRICFNLLVIVFLLVPYLTVEAAPVMQGGNLLGNSDFETLDGGTSTGLAVWAAWWFVDNCKGNDQLNYACQPNGFYPESQPNGAAFIHSGNHAVTVRNNWDPWEGGVKQIVSAPAGSQVHLTVYGHLWDSNQSWASGVHSDTSATVYSRIGIDPNGVDYPTSGSQVIWSGTGTPHDTWQVFSVDATVGASGRVTVIFDTSYRGTSRQFMTASWDDASLTVVSSSGAPTSSGPSQPQPTSPPQVVALPPFVMPTAQADGSVVYIVQPGDSLWRIAANTGLTIDQLKAMNGLTSNLLSTGQHLIIGQGATATPAPTMAPTENPNAATATPEVAAPPAATAPPAGTTEICAALYNDVNGNGVQDSAEGVIAGGQLAILDANTGAPVQAYTTTAADATGHCFKDLPAGTYTVAATAPAGYNPTTAMSVSREAKAGLHYQLSFGAQLSSNAAGGASSGKSGLLGGLSGAGNLVVGALGVILLLMAAGIAGFLVLRRR